MKIANASPAGPAPTTVSFFGRTLLQPGFMVGAGVHQAGRYFSRKNLVQADLITADTGVDFITAARLRFLNKLSISRKGARHGNHIGTVVVK